MSFSKRMAPVAPSMSKADSIGGGVAPFACRRLARSPAVARETKVTTPRETTTIPSSPLRAGCRGIPIPPLSSVMQASSLSTGLARLLPHQRSLQGNRLWERFSVSDESLDKSGKKEAPAPHERRPTGQRFLFWRRSCQSDVIHLGWLHHSRRSSPQSSPLVRREHVARARSAPGAHRQQVRNPLLGSHPAQCRR